MGTALSPRWLALLPLVALLLCAACVRQPVPATGVPPVPAGEPAPRTWLGMQGTPFLLDAAHSSLTMRVYRAGRLAHLGHNHVIEVTDLRGTLTWLDDGTGVAALAFSPDRLRIDEPAARAWAGEDFASQPDVAAIEATRRNLLGPQVLDAQAWPEVRILARVVDLSAAAALAEMHLSVRGFGRRYRLPVSVETGPGYVAVSGSLVVRQSDLGIMPFSVLGGALQVRDAIEVDFRVVGRNSTPAL